MFERIVNTIFFFFLLQHGGTRLSDFYFYIELKAIKVCERLIKLCLRGEVWIEDPGWDWREVKIFAYERF